MTDDLQRRMDADTRNGVFEVNPDHPAFGVSLCPMCGGEVDRHGECCASPDDAEIKLAVQAIEAMSRWAVFKPQLLLVLSHKIVNPHSTIRDIAASIGVGKSQANEFMQQVADIFPVLRPVLGLESPCSRGQANRRKNERNGSR